MHNNNDLALLQDNSTQAMTEVALGLSMAFFALLIIALMSVALPSQAPSHNAANNSSQHLPVDINNTVELSLQASNSENKASSSASANEQSTLDEQFTILLYWEGRYFNTQQQVVNVRAVDTQKEVIIAVSPQLPFAQLMAIQKQFNDDKMRLTTLSSAWQTVLSNLP